MTWSGGQAHSPPIRAAKNSTVFNHLPLKKFKIGPEIISSARTRILDLIFSFYHAQKYRVSSFRMGDYFTCIRAPRDVPATCEQTRAANPCDVLSETTATKSFAVRVPGASST